MYNLLILKSLSFSRKKYNNVHLSKDSHTQRGFFPNSLLPSFLHMYILFKKRWVAKKKKILVLNIISPGEERKFEILLNERAGK